MVSFISNNELNLMGKLKEQISLNTPEIVDALVPLIMDGIFQNEKILSQFVERLNKHYKIVKGKIVKEEEGGETENLKCQGTTKTGQPCKNKIAKNGFCKRHDTVESVVAIEKITCFGKTQSGKRCKNIGKTEHNQEMYCKTHFKKASAQETIVEDDGEFIQEMASTVEHVTEVISTQNHEEIVEEIVEETVEEEETVEDLDEDTQNAMDDLDALMDEDEDEIEEEEEEEEADADGDYVDGEEEEEDDDEASQVFTGFMFKDEEFDLSNYSDEGTYKSVSIMQSGTTILKIKQSERNLIKSFKKMDRCLKTTATDKLLEKCCFKQTEDDKKVVAEGIDIGCLLSSNCIINFERNNDELVIILE